jgi:hypothetical protein
MFVTWAYVQAGSTYAFAQGKRWAYTPAIAADARHHRHGLRVVGVSEVRPGDLVVYDLHHRGHADHVGLFVGWIKYGSSFRAIEGNTSELGGNQNDGVVVALKGINPKTGRPQRTMNMVEEFVRVEKP